MSDRESDLPDLVGELARTTEQLRDELERERRGPSRRPRFSDLVEFTSEVTIPAIVLILETNVRALRLLQRTLRFTQDRTRETDQSTSAARERAEELGRETLERLDDALGDLQGALSDRPTDSDARALLAEARDLRADIESRLEATAAEAESAESAGADLNQAPDRDDVPVDVEGELQSIKDDMTDAGDAASPRGDDGEDDTDDTP